ncbi:MAG: rod shape-determining protein MreD [Verrucomicrobia bacterium]|nr:rod shape-determining protein MreD [Verrucomicrobiota bacterium]|tara:strand:+ start:551 stop:1069 length:519 start_codon:yes stop_codon:yes gene_type:complete
MIRSYFIYPIQFLVLVLLQVLILNNIQFYGFINPFLYLIFILWMPFETPKFLLMSISFLTGLTIDMFSNTMGMHASASVFLAFCRPFVVKIFAPRDGYEVSHRPSIHDLGLGWFLKYAAILVLCHHLFLFFVEVFRFTEFWNTLGRVLSSAFFTLISILIAEYFRVNVESER